MIFGWDASDFDFQRGLRAEHIAAGAKEGIEFFTHKATEQTPQQVWAHTQFGRQVAAARDAGIPFIGAYVVARTGVPASEQASTAAQFVRQNAGFLLEEPIGFRRFFWQVDLEHWEYDIVDARIGDRLAQALELQTGHGAVIYAPRWAYGDTIPGSRAIWNSDYRDSGLPAHFSEQWRRVAAGGLNQGFQRMSGRVPRILQFTEEATIGGQAGCDANVFMGTLDEFEAMITLL